MSLEFLDSCDHYDTAHILDKWDAIPNTGINASVAIVAAPTGMNVNCIEVSNGTGSAWALQKNVASEAEKLVHFSFNGNFPAAGYVPCFALSNAGNLNLVICISEAGTVSVWTTEVGPPVSQPVTLVTKLCESSTGIIAENVTAVISAAFVCSTTVGSVVLAVNGQQVASVSGVDTSPDATGVYSQINLMAIPNASGTAMTFYFDDIIIANTSGTYNNTLIPPQRVGWEYATADGALSQMTANGAGANWQCVTNTTPNPDDDTTYVSAATDGLTDTNDMSVLSGLSSVSGSQWVGVCKTSDGGAATVTPQYGNGSTTAAGTAIVVPSGYKALLQCSDVNPLTSNPWLVADLTGLQIGIERSA